ncbi:head decoration protein [Pelagibacterium montanilacus]|uniref:head decoration protein n=1 Tax=Pelagibacterium montanilacus TaxID=2185280 RepID=UPI000F8D0E41|nr:head decoration protein [Pelagibacterium montanilacus]
MLGKSFTVGAPKLLTAFLKFETDPQFCREELVLLAGSSGPRKIEIGTPLGLATDGDPEASALAGNTGDGTIALADPALGSGVVPGIYRVLCMDVGTPAVFEVFDPAGVSLGSVDAGDPFDDVVKFTITAGSEAFAEGDGFEIVVPEGTKAKAWDPEATDGSQIFHGFALVRTAAPEGADSRILALEQGPAVVLEDEIVFPTGLPAEDRLALITAARAKAIKVRRG